MSRKPITVSLPENLVREASRFCKKHDLTVSEVTREALRNYLYREELEEARRKFTVHVRKLGVKSEQDLIKTVTKK